jgi:hypothetical protein
VPANSAGTASPTSFPGSSSGTVVTLQAGKYYQLTSTGPSGYTETLSNDCDSARGGLPVAGASETCHVDKYDRAPQLNVFTVVDNTGGGTQSPSDWTMTVTGTNVVPSSFAGTSAGRTVHFDANTAFSVGSSPAGSDYTLSTSGTCSGSGLALGVVASCTFTFTYNAPSPTAVIPFPPLILPVLVRVRRRFRGS